MDFDYIDYFQNVIGLGPAEMLSKWVREGKIKHYEVEKENGKHFVEVTFIRINANPVTMEEARAKSAIVSTQVGWWPRLWAKITHRIPRQAYDLGEVVFIVPPQEELTSVGNGSSLEEATFWAVTGVLRSLSPEKGESVTTAMPI